MASAVGIDGGNQGGGPGELLRLAWPLILSNSIWTLQITLDRIFLGHHSSEALAASMPATMLFWTPMALLQYTANYATTFVAQYTGAGQDQRVGPVVWQALYFAVPAGFAFMALVPAGGLLMSLGGHSAPLQELETTYFQCLCFSALPTLVTAAASSFFAGRGDSLTVLLINAAGLGVNGLSAYVLIFGNWDFPALGIAGAGWATVLGTSTSALLALGLMFLPRFRARYGTASGWSLDRPLLRRLLRFGFPNGLVIAFDCLAFTLFIFLVGRQGEVELAASNLAFTLNLLAFMPLLGVCQAVTILVGQRLGENRPDLAEKSTWAGFWLGLLFMGIFVLAYLVIPEQLALLFRDENDEEKWAKVAALVPGLLRFVAFYCMFDAVNQVFSFALRGAGDTRFVTWVAVVLSWPVMVVPTWAAVEYDLGIYWAWTFATLYIVALAFVFWARFRGGKWQKMRVIETVEGLNGAPQEHREGNPKSETIPKNLRKKTQN